jgi:hypothetical protein
MASAFKVPATRLLVRCVSERIRWSRGAFEETPAGELCIVDREQGARIAALRDRYQVQYERRMSAATSLDRAGLFRDGRARIDYAAGYLRRRPDAHFVVADYGAYHEPADLITHGFRYLRPQGVFFLVIHGPQEAASAERLCTAAGLVFMARAATPGGVEQASIDAAGTVLVDASITLKIFVFISKLL